MRLPVNAAHLTSIILRKADSLEEVLEFSSERKPQALVFGPGLGPHDKVGRFALELLAAASTASPHGMVIDADATDLVAATAATTFSKRPRRPGAPAIRADAA